jgi:hypothetical protein
MKVLENQHFQSSQQKSNKKQPFSYQKPTNIDNQINIIN